MSLIDTLVKDAMPQVVNTILASFVNKPISVGPIHFTVAGAAVTIGPIPVQIALAPKTSPAVPPHLSGPTAGQG